MKKFLFLPIFFLLILACSKESVNEQNDVLLSTRSNKHIQIKVQEPNTKNAVGEAVHIFLGSPGCTCELANTPDSNCKETSSNFLVADGNADSDFVTDKNGKVKVIGTSKGFFPHVEYTACVQYFSATPCNLNDYEECGDGTVPGFGKCEWAATCVKFTTNGNSGTNGQIKLKKK